LLEWPKEHIRLGVGNNQPLMKTPTLPSPLGHLKNPVGPSSAPAPSQHDHEMLFDTNDYLVNEDPEQDKAMYDFLDPSICLACHKNHPNYKNH
jgi:hypothetical protein